MQAVPRVMQKKQAVPRVMQKTSCSTCHAKKQAVPHVAKTMQKTSCSTCCKKPCKKPCKMRRVWSANPPNPYSPWVPCYMWAGERRLRLARQQLAQQANQLCVALLLGGPRHAGDLESVRVAAQHQQLVTAAERHAGGHVKVSAAHVAAGVVGFVLLLVAPRSRQGKVREGVRRLRLTAAEGQARQEASTPGRWRGRAPMPGRFAETVGLDNSFEIFFLESAICAISHKATGSLLYVLSVLYGIEACIHSIST